jgi:hypothetical protein
MSHWRTLPKPNRKPNNVTLSEQFQSPIDKWKTNNATLSEQYQSTIENQIMTHSQNKSTDRIIVFSIGLWKYSVSVTLFVFLLDFGTVATEWYYLLFYCTLEQFWPCEYYLFFYGALEIFPQCSIIGVSIGLWNWSESVTLFVLLLDFGTVPTVWYYLFWYGTLELFR